MNDAEQKEKKPSTLADRMDDQAKGIVSVINPETEKYFAELLKRLKAEDQSCQNQTNKNLHGSHF